MQKKLKYSIRKKNNDVAGGIHTCLVITSVKPIEDTCGGSVELFRPLRRWLAALRHACRTVQAKQVTIGQCG